MSLQNRSETFQERVIGFAHSAATVALTPILIGGAVLIPLNSADANATNAFLYAGLISGAPMASVTPAAFAKCYWDNTAKVFTNVATDNTLCGNFLEAVASGTTTGLICFNGFGV